MRRALELARTAEPFTSPSPLVGCVVIRDGRILGEGCHRGPGTLHAERVALFRAGQRAKGATLVVNLEPCNHWGRTPPCTDIIVQAGVRRVLVGHLDPWRHVKGNGFQVLQARGIQVETGILQRECMLLNRTFLVWATYGRPYVLLKLAQTLDARITVPGRRWLTSEEARDHARRLRYWCDAVLVGARTIREDDPRLTIRLPGLPEKKILRVVLDAAGRISERARIWEGGEVAIFSTFRSSREWRQRMQRRGALLFLAKEWRPPQILRVLAELGIGRLLVEGGAQVARMFLESDLVDEFALYHAPHLGGRRGRPWAPGQPMAKRFQLLRAEPIGSDVCSRWIRWREDVYGNYSA